MTAPIQNYLSKTGSGIVQGDGTATVQLVPSVGEYWSPMMVRVSTTSKNTSYCAVFHGAATISDATTFIDDTYTGSGDASSFIAGTIVQYGDSIIAQWSGGNPGDAAILTIYGIYSNVPPSQGFVLPSTPGSHFGGHISGEQLLTLVQIPTTSLAFSASFTTALLDVKPFTSYYLDIFASGPVAPTAYNSVLIAITFVDPSGQDSYEDFYEPWIAQAGSFPYASGTVMIQDKVHGSRMKIKFINPNADTITVAGFLTGTSRDVGQPYVRQQVVGQAGSGGVNALDNGVDGILINTNGFSSIANGATFKYLCPLTYGYVALKGQTGAGGLGVNIGAGSVITPGNFDSFAVAANTGFGPIQYIAPKRALVVNVNNGSGVLSSIRLQMIGLFDKV